MPSLVDYLAKKSKGNDLEIINQEKLETMKLQMYKALSVWHSSPRLRLNFAMHYAMAL
jgi:hypothetical protein